ncbi:MAG: chemotaxis-specific protein-glutamate methyltransferase CheB [Lachnospiraceae bacterium]|nr:chemotaxis-specific protein-glutamate methyltransferase CheB [Lachnospiraceae bacterium]
MAKKILIVDDSALMRRIICDIIALDDRLCVADTAEDGLVGMSLLSRNTYDLILLDLTMPRMGGIEFLKELKKKNIQVNVVVCSTLVNEGADITLEALSLGAVDFVKKPDGIFDARGEKFQKKLLGILNTVLFEAQQPVLKEAEPSRIVHAPAVIKPGEKVVAIASSTGGPKALLEVIPRLPKDLNAPVLLVQHMPKGFTATMAGRLDALSPLKVQEAEEGMKVEKGNVYIAKGGIHMTVAFSEGCHRICFLDAPHREGVKPSANYMYESLAKCRYDHVISVVLTGMGADGTEGIKNLSQRKDNYVIVQNQETCAVYGMPKSAAEAGLAKEVVPLTQVANAIIKNVGVIKDGR